MNEARDIRTIVVGVDGSEASVEALRQAQGLALPLSATVVALACWDNPPVYDGYVAVGIDDFDVRAGEILAEAVVKAYGPETPARLVRGAKAPGAGRPASFSAWLSMSSASPRVMTLHAVSSRTSYPSISNTTGLAVMAPHNLVPPEVRKTIARRASTKFTGKISGWLSTISATRPTVSVSSRTQHWSG